MKFLTKINGLITKAESRTIHRAAKLLASGDHYDAYFFSVLKRYARESTESSIKLDDDGRYVVLETTKPAQDVKVRYSEVK